MKKKNKKKSPATRFSSIGQKLKIVFDFSRLYLLFLSLCSSCFSGSPSSQHHSSSMEGTLSGLTVKDADDIPSMISHNQLHQLQTQLPPQRLRHQLQHPPPRQPRPLSSVLPNQLVEAVQYQHIMPSTFSSPSGLINLATRYLLLPALST